METDEERKSCKMCGKKLPEKEMFKKEMAQFFCCQICYEMYTGKPYSDDPEFQYQ